MKCWFAEKICSFENKLHNIFTSTNHNAPAINPLRYSGIKRTMLFCLQSMPKNCYGNQPIFLLFLISTYLIFFRKHRVWWMCLWPINWKPCAHKKAPKSVLSFRKSKGKEWKSLVSKSDPGGKKRKEADVVVYISLMEWNENSGSLKPKRGKKLALRTSPLATYSVLRPDAEEKWKTYHSNLYDSSDSYHLLYEDGTRALFLPGPEKELFTLRPVSYTHLTLPTIYSV